MVKLAKLLFGALAVALLYLALRGLDWHSFLISVVTLNLAWACACLLLELTALIARAYRWNLLLAYRTGSHPFISFVGEAVGDVGNTFLPARAGEALRAVVVARQLNTSMPFVIGTIAAERLSDAVFVSILAFLMTLLVPHVPVWLTGIALLFCSLGLVASLVIAFLPTFNQLVFPLLERLKPFRAFIEKIEHVFSDVWQGSQALFGHPGRMLFYTAVTALFWVADGLAVQCLAKALGTYLSLSEALLFLSALGLSSAIPSTPGYIGIYQFVAVSLLVPLGLLREKALAIVLIYQLTTLLLQLASAGLGWLLFMPHASVRKR